MVEATNKAKNFLTKFLGDIDKNEATKQILMGAGSGWISGFVAMKVAKTTAFAVGGGIILLQIANETGFVQVNWKKLNKKLEKVADRGADLCSNDSKKNHDELWSEKLLNFFKKNTPFTSGFVGGFFIGIAS